MDNEFLSFVTQFDLVFCSETWQRRNDKFKIEGYNCICVLLRARRNEKEMKVKPATSFKLLTIFIPQKKIRQDSKQKNVSRLYLSSLCHKDPLK